EREVRQPSLAVTAASSAPLAAGLQPVGRLPLGPVVVQGALDLVGGSGDPPEESGRSLRSQVSGPKKTPMGSNMQTRDRNLKPGSWKLEAGSWNYASGARGCFTQRASAMKMVSSQMFVARSPTRSRFFEIEISSMQYVVRAGYSAM